MTPRFVTRTWAAASISSPDAWHQAMTTANSVTAAPTKTMNTSARRSPEPVAAMTRASTSDPITTPHDTAPVRRRGTGMAESAVRRCHQPTAPARATVLSFDNDAQATERDLGSSILDPRVGSIHRPRRDPPRRPSSRQATRPGFEPGKAGPKPAVIPFHHRVMTDGFSVAAAISAGKATRRRRCRPVRPCRRTCGTPDRRSG